MNATEKMNAAIDAGVVISDELARSVAAERRVARLASDRGTTTVGRWTVQVQEYQDRVSVCGDPLPYRWIATVWYGVYDGERSFRGESRTEVETAVAEYLAPHTILLDPLDVWCDLRVTGTPVLVPVGGEITVKLPRSKRHPEGRTVGPLTAGLMRSLLQDHGFIAIATVR